MMNNNEVGAMSAAQTRAAGAGAPEPDARLGLSAASTIAKTDAELAEAMLPGNPDGLAVVARISPERRALYEHMLWVADELNAGRVPPGVLL